MTHPRYKAYVTLAQTVLNSEFTPKHPILETKSSFDKNSVFDLVRAMFNQELIIAYHMVYSPNSEEDNYYNDEEVIYLPEGTKTVSIF